MQHIFLKIISQMFRSFFQILLFHLKSEIRLELKLKTFEIVGSKSTVLENLRSKTFCFTVYKNIKIFFLLVAIFFQPDPKTDKR